MIEKAVILAAGLGTRMISLTNGGSKEMLLLKGKPLIHYAIKEAIDSGCSEVCIISNVNKKDLNGYLENEKKNGSKIEIIFREPKGIIDAFLASEEFVKNDSFCVILPDMLSLNKTPAIKEAIEEYNKNKKAVIGLIKDSGEIGKGSYVMIDKIKENIYSIKGINNSNESKTRFFGRYVLPNKFFSYLKNRINDESEKNVLLDFINSNELHGVMYSGNIFDAGIPEGYELAKKFVENKNGIYINSSKIR